MSAAELARAWIDALVWMRNGFEQDNNSTYIDVMCTCSSLRCVRSLNGASKSQMYVHVHVVK